MQRITSLVADVAGWPRTTVSKRRWRRESRRPPLPPPWQHIRFSHEHIARADSSEGRMKPAHASAAARSSAGHPRPRARSSRPPTDCYPLPMTRSSSRGAHGGSNLCLPPAPPLPSSSLLLPVCERICATGDGVRECQP